MVKTIKLGRSPVRGGKLAGELGNVRKGAKNSECKLLSYDRLSVFLVIGILIININLVSAGLYYDVSLYYDRGNIKINSVEVEFSNYELENYTNEELFLVYSSKIIDNEDNVLAESFFNVPNKQLYDIVDNETGIITSGGVIELENVSFNIFLPYYENAKEIVIYNENKNELNRKSLIEFSKEYSREGYERITGKEKIEKETTEKIDYKENFVEKLSGYWQVLVVILVILVTIFIYLMKNEKGKKR